MVLAYGGKGKCGEIEREFERMNETEEEISNVYGKISEIILWMTVLIVIFTVIFLEIAVKEQKYNSTT